MTIFERYLLFQIPGWVIAVVLLVVFCTWFGLSVGWAITIFALYVAKDFVLYPFLRRAYETGTPTGVGRLIGARAIVQTRLDPQGFVRLHGELWKARLEIGQGPLERGSFVRVRRAEGLTLFVVPEDGAQSNLDPDFSPARNRVQLHRETGR